MIIKEVVKRVMHCIGFSNRARFEITLMLIENRKLSPILRGNRPAFDDTSSLVETQHLGCACSLFLPS